MLLCLAYDQSKANEIKSPTDILATNRLTDNNMKEQSRRGYEYPVLAINQSIPIQYSSKKRETQWYKCEGYPGNQIKQGETNARTQR